MRSHAPLSRALPALLTITALAITPEVVRAQQPPQEERGALALKDVQDYTQRRARTNEVGMLVLMSWAGLNIASGLAGWGLADSKQWRAFHQMNAMWNVVNLGIGYLGYRGAKKAALEEMSFSQSLDAGFDMERLWAFNAGLDVGYIMLGAYMWERGRRLDDPRWKGFGQSVIAQGTFLMGFDLLMMFKNKAINDELLSLQVTLARSAHGALMPGVRMIF